MKEVTDVDFNDAIKTGTVLVDFWATWCVPCKFFMPVLESLEKETPNVTFLKADIDKARESVSALKIKSVPCLILFKEGVEVKRWVGIQKKEEIVRSL